LIHISYGPVSAINESIHRRGQMGILFLTSEVHPFAKTGGLADVSAALPRALSERGMDVRVLMPAYPSHRSAHIDELSLRSRANISRPDEPGYSAGAVLRTGP
jgi:hypothetical protein